jgi:hypothetical protein
MSIQGTVADFLEDVRTFNRAMDAPFGDVEIDAACKMRDSAILMLRRIGANDAYVTTALHEYESDQDK